MSERRSTATSNFGVGRRESHDATVFYARFEPPEVTRHADVVPPRAVRQPFVCGDARRMDTVDDNSVALVVTSPPYFAGKQYEEELGRDGVPASYLEYLELLRDVFAECKRKLEPGGRIAVNVANLGRKPYRSLASDVIRILQDDLKLLLRGEVVWRKGEGASGSCAWGSYRSAANPVLRDLTERVVIASKGQFDRAVTPARRDARGLPHANTISGDEFMAATLDVWEIAAESAQRVRHPAPFPVELPERLIHLLTYRDDLVLDPFMGSGSGLVAAARTGRRYVGYDLDPEYVALARRRVEAELADGAVATAAPARPGKAVAEDLLTTAGFRIVSRGARQRGLGLAVDFIARDGQGRDWYFDVSGAFTVTPNGLARTAEVWRVLGRASVLGASGRRPYVVLTTHLPKVGTDGARALHAAGPAACFDVVRLQAVDDAARVAHYAQGGNGDVPLGGFWTDAEVAPNA